MALRAGSRRTWGYVRRLPSARFQASYPGYMGQRVTAPWTFDTKMDAEAWLVAERRILTSGEWTSPKYRQARDLRESEAKRSNTFATVAREWLDRKSTLRQSTRASYRTSIEKHLVPTFGDMPMADISARTVDTWFAGYRDNAPTARAHAYQVLASIMLEAVADGVIERSPCRVRGGRMTRPRHEAEVLTVEEMWGLYEAMPRQHAPLVLLAGVGGLRLGEALALRVRDVDFAAETVRVEGTIVREGGLARATTPKTPAGRRVVHLPRTALDVVRDHLAANPTSSRDDLIFRTASGGPVSHSTVYGQKERSVRRGGTITRRRAYGFAAAKVAIGRPELVFHDLRHTAATLAVAHGATGKEVMARLGHTDYRTALHYQAAEGGAGSRDRAAPRRALGSSGTSAAVDLAPGGR